MRISDWSSDVCSSDLSQIAGLCCSLHRERAGVYERDQGGDGLGFDQLNLPRRASGTPLAADIQGRQRQVRLCPLQMGECRSEEHTSELQSLMRISYAVFCLKKNK